MALTRNWKTKNYMAFGLGMRAFTFAAAIFVSHSFHLFLMAIMFSFVLSDYWVVPLVITLEFVSGTVEFGAFFSYLALAGAISALALGRRSDHEGKRNKYIRPVMRLRGAAMILAGFADSFLLWFVSMGAIRYLGSIKWPFTWTLVTESANNIDEAMLAREFWLNAGRLFAMFVAIACLSLFGSVQYGLIVGGLASMAFPAVMEYRKL